jgi:menaquinone-dependent protoporphyrinogen oxidase
MKVLIVYGTRYGSAAEIAAEIRRVIKNKGIEVDMLDSSKLNDYDVSTYDLVVVGSGIKMGKWTKNSLKFLKDNKSSLANKKVALFVTCGDANNEKTRDYGWENYLKKVSTENLLDKPIDMGLFGSVYDPNVNHGLIHKLATKFIIKKQLDKQGIDTSKRLDYRNWDEIRTWAGDLTYIS